MLSGLRSGIFRVYLAAAHVRLMRDEGAGSPSSRDARRGFIYSRVPAAPCPQQIPVLKNRSGVGCGRRWLNDIRWAFERDLPKMPAIRLCTRRACIDIYI